MELFKSLPIFLLIGVTLALYEDYNLDTYEDYHHKPVHQEAVQELHKEEYDLDYHSHPKYSFDYSVKDPHTGDDKEHWETRDGDKVKGSYTLIETDGTKRVVEYEADDKNGFNAVVHRIGTPNHHEEYKAPVYAEYEHKQKPVHESYGHDYQQLEAGFAPVGANYEY